MCEYIIALWDNQVIAVRGDIIALLRLHPGLFGLCFKIQGIEDSICFWEVEVISFKDETNFVLYDFMLMKFG